jgi:hypothetical protein
MKAKRCIKKKETDIKEAKELIAKNKASVEHRKKIRDMIDKLSELTDRINRPH